jgi:hypothetical protein
MQLVGHELGQRVPAGLVGPLLLEGQQVFPEYAIERGLFRLPARIDRFPRRDLCACRCLHRGELSAIGSRKLRDGSSPGLGVARQLQYPSRDDDSRSASPTVMPLRVGDVRGPLLHPARPGRG